MRDREWDEWAAGLLADEQRKAADWAAATAHLFDQPPRDRQPKQKIAFIGGQVYTGDSPEMRRAEARWSRDIRRSVSGGVADACRARNKAMIAAFAAGNPLKDPAVLAQCQEAERQFTNRVGNSLGIAAQIQ